MKTFFSIIGSLLVIAFIGFCGAVIYFKYFDKGYSGPSKEERIYTWVYNRDHTLVKASDEITEGAIYLIGFGSMEDTQQANAKANQKSSNGTIEFILSTTETPSSAQDYVTMTAGKGMTWGEWIETTYNIYGFRVFNNCIWVNPTNNNTADE